MNAVARRFAALLAVCAALLISPLANGQESRERIDVGKLTVETEFLAASGSQGYAPLVFTVTSSAEEGALPVEIRASTMFGVEAPVAVWNGVVPAGATVAGRLLVPSFALHGQLRVFVRAGSDVGNWTLQPDVLAWPVDGKIPRSPRTVALFYVSGQGVPNSATVEFGRALSQQALPPAEPFLENAPYSYNADDWALSSTRTTRVIAPLSSTAPGTAGAPTGHYQFVGLDLHKLPSRAIELTSASGVVLDVAAGWPTPPQLAVLIEYVRLGGVLAVVGFDRQGLLQRSNLLAPYLEPRFELAGFDDGSGRVAVQGLGLGRLIASPLRITDPLEVNGALRAALWWCFERESTGTASIGTGQSPFEQASLMELPMVLPPGVLAAVCLVIALVVGPLNFMMVWRRRRPALLLVTVPVLSLGIAAFIAAFGMVRLGFDISATGASLAVLDQRSGELSVTEARGMFAGFTLQEGLSPEPGSVVIPLAVGFRFGSFPDIRVERNGGLLKGAFLPPRERSRAIVVSARRTRQRLDVEPAALGDTVTVANGFEAQIAELVLHSGDGRYFRATDAIEPGAKVSLVPCEPADARALLRYLSPGIDYALTTQLARGTYAARLGGPVLVADLGVPLDWDPSGLERHGVIGILEERQ